jgi:type III pantothenate kinase
MLLALDIGNTNITAGVIEKEKIITTFRLTTGITRTSDEYGLLIVDLLEKKGIHTENIKDVIVSSVVPNIMYSLVSGIKKYLNKKPIIIGPGTKTGIRLNVPNAHEIGPDRIVDCAGAYYIYGGPVLVIDFGTATTYDLVTESGGFEAGITSPGIMISAKALWQDTAKLPEIEIKKPDTILAKETITSMQAGLVYGYIGQTEYIIDNVKKESGLDNMKVVATGGLGRIIADATDKIDVYDPDLTLHGMRLIYDRCKK